MALDGLGNVFVSGFGSDNVFKVEAAECFLVIGDGSGDATFFELNHLFTTQLGVVQDSYPVLMDAIPEFVLPAPGPSMVGVGGAHGGPQTTLAPTSPPAIPRWMADGAFTVQILLWNPAVYPDQPEQFSSGLAVRVHPDGSVTTRPYGTSTGIDVWAETSVDAQGRPVIRFPFAVPMP